MITLAIDFEITDRLIELFAESTSDQFIGDPNNIRGIEWASAELNKVKETGMWHGFHRLGILKAYIGDELVAWSMPRIITPEEYTKLMLPCGVTDIYRMGTIYVAPEHRGKGIAKEIMMTYMDDRPKQVWLADPANIGSQKTAMACGLQPIGNIWFAEDGIWSHLPLADYTSSRIVYSTV